MASEMPVLPDVGSSTVTPGRSSPSFSAAATMYRAARSFTDPVGLSVSSFAQSRTSGDGDKRGSPTSGVRPTDSSSESNRKLSAGDSRQDGDRVPVVQSRLEPAEEADVLVVDVDVDEPVQPAVLGDEPTAQPRVPPVEVVEQAGEGLALALDGLLAVGVRAQDRGDPDLDGHGVSGPSAEYGGVVGCLHRPTGADQRRIPGQRTWISSSVTSPPSIRNDLTSSYAGSRVETSSQEAPGVLTDQRMSVRDG